MSCRDQKPVITARVETHDGRASEAAYAIGFKPLLSESEIEVRARPVRKAHLQFSAASGKPGIKRHAAVGENARARNVIRLVGGKKYSNAGNVFGLPDALIGN